MVPWLSSSMRLRRSETGFGDDHPVAIGRISDRRVIFSLRFERQTVLTTAQGRDRQMPQPSSACHQAPRNFESRKRMLKFRRADCPGPLTEQVDRESCSKCQEHESKRSRSGKTSDNHPARRHSRSLVLPCHHPHARGHSAGRHRPPVMTVADQVMHLILPEVEKLDRVANAIAPKPLRTQDRILERNRKR